MIGRLRDLIRRALTKRRVVSVGADRKVRVKEDPPSDQFTLIVALMVVFFVGLSALQVVHMLIFRAWNEAIFSGIMLIVGTIVGAVWGRSK